MGLQISTPDGEVWRSAMIDLPFFPVATPQAFYELLRMSGSKDPDAEKNFAAAHPEFAVFGAWAKSAPWTASYAEEQYNGLNSFIFVDNAGAEHAVRWSLLPSAPVVPISDDDLAKLGPNHLEQDIADRVAKAPQRWTMVVTLANPGRSDGRSEQGLAGGTPHRRGRHAGGAADRSRTDGPCRDINFDPTILPDGIEVSDDPFPAARSSAYAKSYDLRTSEVKDYPYRQQAAAGEKP